MYLAIYLIIQSFLWLDVSVISLVVDKHHVWERVLLVAAEVVVAAVRKILVALKKLVVVRNSALELRMVVAENLVEGEHSHRTEDRYTLADALTLVFDVVGEEPVPSWG